MKFPSLIRKNPFDRGVHPPQCKSSTSGLAIRRLPFAQELRVPLLQHTGAPARPIVREGQEVVRGEPIAAAGGFVSVPMHAPVTGVVDRIDLALTARGDMTRTIFIRSYPGASQEILYGAPRNIEIMTPEELIDAVQDTGVVGLGGAAFPTHVKLKPPPDKSIDTIIVNGCECEPYLTTDHRVMLEYVDDLYAGIQIVSRAVGCLKVIVAVEDNKGDAAAVLEERLSGKEGLTVQTLATQYPQGAEKMLTKALLDREIPSGGLPADVGTLVFNVATLSQIGDLLPRRQGLIERVVTITGPGVGRPGNYLVALGTPLSAVFDMVGIRPGANQVILGGPMMGVSIASLDVPITKGVTGILVLAPNDVSTPNDKIYPCIKCGRCLEVCPIHLNPSRLGLLARKGAYEVMEDRYHLNDCFECGCCSYVCPSKIPLVQYFRIAKAMNKEGKQSRCP